MTDVGLTESEEGIPCAAKSASEEGSTSEASAEGVEPAHPPGEYAIVEILGYQTLVGRFEEVQRFGTAMLKIEPIFNGRLLDPVYQGGASIYRFNPCSAAQAFERAPTESYHLPAAVRVLMPPEALPAPDEKELKRVAGERDFDDYDDDYGDDYEEHF